MRCCFSWIHLDFYILVWKISWKVITCMLNHGWHFVILWTAGHQALPSVGFPRQDYWHSLQFPPPWDLPSPEIQPTSPVSLALAGYFFTTEPSGKSKDISLNKIRNLSWNPMSNWGGIKMVSQKIQSSSLIDTPKLQLHIGQLFLRMIWRLAE